MSYVSKEGAASKTKTWDHGDIVSNWISSSWQVFGECNYLYYELAAVFSFLIFVPLSAQAEYRAYLLKIESTSSKSVRLVESTLDNIQYPEYYSVLATEKITLDDTWMCYLNSSQFEEICPRPSRQTAGASQIPSTSSQPAETTQGDKP